MCFKHLFLKYYNVVGMKEERGMWMYGWGGGGGVGAVLGKA